MIGIANTEPIALSTVEGCARSACCLWLIAYGSYVPTICHKRSALCHFGSHRLERFEFFFLAAFGFQLNRGVLDVEALLEGVLDAVEDLMKIAAVFYHSVSA